MSAWSWLVLGVGLWVFQSPFTAAFLTKWLASNIKNEEDQDEENHTSTEAEMVHQEFREADLEDGFTL